MSLPPPRPDSADSDFTGAKTVWMKRSQWDGPMRSAMIAALPAGARLGFNYDGDRAWVMVSRPHDTEAVYLQARRSLGR
jgi:hypothetical protein